MLRLQPAEVNDLHLLFPAAGDGYIALSQLLSDMDWAEPEPEPEASCSSESSSSRQDYLTPVSTARDAALPPPIPRSDGASAEAAVALSSRGKRARELAAVCKPLLLRLCGVYLLEARRRARRDGPAANAAAAAAAAASNAVAATSAAKGKKPPLFCAVIH